MKKIIILFSIQILFSLSVLQAQKGHEIKVKIIPFKDTTVILGHHFAGSMYPDDTIRLDKNSNGVFKGNEPLPQGMYLVFLPNKSYFDVMIGENQHFSVETDTSDLFRKTKFTKSEENTAFYNYQYFLSDKRKEANEWVEKRKNATTEAEKKVCTEKLKVLDSEVKAFIEKSINTNPGSMFAAFAKATKEVEVPDPPRDTHGNIIDSAFQYKYYRSHYFDNFDIADVRLLRTPLYENKVKTYIEKVVPQIPDSIYPEVDMLIAKSRTSPELFRYMLVTLFNLYGQSQIMGFDAIALYIGEKYYIKEATWADTAYIKKLKDQIAIRTPLNIGKVAPDIRLVNVPNQHFIEAKDSVQLKKNPYIGNFFNLSEVKGKFIVLAFWESDCGHCKKTIPELHKVYQKIKDKGLVVVSVHMLGGEEGKEKWVNFVNEHKLTDWINAWNPYDYAYKKSFDITSTPVIFVLDNDHKIIAKRIGTEQIEDFITHYEKQKK